VLVITAALAVGGASAQTVTNTTPGKPIPLLQIAAQSDKTKTKAHVKSLAAKRTTKTHRILAARKHSHRPTQTAAAAAPVAAIAPASVWPASALAAPTEVASTESAPPPTPAQALTEPAPSELVVAGRAVRIASPDDVNEIDLAAKDADAAVSLAAPSETVETEPQSHPAEAETAQPAASAVGSASWIAQVLAALGGAVAAGSVAWFLIGSTPHRMYG
jgi:hypothetical protein